MRAGMFDLSGILLLALTSRLALAASPDPPDPPVLLTLVAVLGAGALAAVWWLRGHFERRRLVALFDEMRRSWSGIPEVYGHGDAVDVTRATIEYLARTLAGERQLAQAQAEVRQRVESELRASEERYALALMGADEGWWEWDLRSSKVIYSERWRCMLGLTPADVGQDIEDWCRRIHPADRERVRTDLRAHLEGVTPRFENEHRVLHRDGGYRWVLARATALRNATGKAQRMIGLATDVTARKQVQQAVMDIADGLEALHGDACLRALVQSFAKVLGVREVFVCECVDDPATQVRMLARWKNDEHDRCVAFDLAGTPCEQVIQSGRLLYVPKGLGGQWPVETQYQRESYLGIPCVDSRGRVLGHIACADPAPLPEALPHEALLRIFAARAAIELEWRALEQARDHNVGGHWTSGTQASVPAKLRRRTGPMLN